jgi:beta-phosphoglucomutase-like phosphatase (HAD superfamily)
VVGKASGPRVQFAGAIIEAIVDNAGWGSLFSIRCSADDDASGKPAPDVYLRAARLLDVHPSDCLALEDSPNGARAAVAAGMTCYAVPDLSHTRRSAFDGITRHVFRHVRVLDDLKRS